MRVTEKKLQANRQNAKKSTGPKTDEGKKIVSQNGVKHGLYTRALILNSPHLKEDLTDYNGLIFALDRTFLPEGLLEEFLIRKLTNCLWRSRRIIDAENAQIIRQLDSVERDTYSHFKYRHAFEGIDKPPTDEEEECVRSTFIGKKSIPNEGAGKHLMRYEMRLDRQMTRILKTLDYLQKRRKANEDKEKRMQEQKMRDQSQSSRNPVIYNPLKDIT
jgi:hypothetical protein